MPKIAKLISITAALFALLATQAVADVNLRSPDAVDAAFNRAEKYLAEHQDLRSPDAVDASNSAPRDQSVATYQTAQASPSSDDDFEWGFVGLGIAATLCIGGTLVTVRHRRRRRSPGQLVGARS